MVCDYDLTADQWFAVCMDNSLVVGHSDNYLILTKRKRVLCDMQLQWKMHCTRDVQQELGVRGHDLLKLMLGRQLQWPSLYFTSHLSLKH